jgi:hypothetical protein
MNQYQANYLSQAALTETPFYLNFIYYLLFPLIIGSSIDVGFNTFMGPQICSFDGEEKKCNILGKNIPAWVRELSRSVLQLVVFFLILFLAKTYFKASLFPICGLGILIATQPDLYEDFRRFINSILFMIKYN